MSKPRYTIRAPSTILDRGTFVANCDTAIDAQIVCSWLNSGETWRQDAVQLAAIRAEAARISVGPTPTLPDSERDSLIAVAVYWYQMCQAAEQRAAERAALWEAVETIAQYAYLQDYLLGIEAPHLPEDPIDSWDMFMLSINEDWRGERETTYTRSHEVHAPTPQAAIIALAAAIKEGK